MGDNGKSERKEKGWYAVRCVFAAGPWDDGTMTYEERITLWHARSSRKAIEKAEAEANDYASEIDESPVTYLGLAQSFHLFDVPGPGAEIFSLMRDSTLEPDDYLATFFSNGDERSSDYDED
ncbi:MAG TPA: hypothetical protein VFE15_07630 [Marmoricola sp.]|jgi:hypothetical protein|nr:hypothetical protein [Marmoricola sp.]